MPAPPGGSRSFDRNAIPFSLNSSVYSVAAHLFGQFSFSRKFRGVLDGFATRICDSSRTRIFLLAATRWRATSHITFNDKSTAVCKLSIAQSCLFIQFFHFGHFFCRRHTACVPINHILVNFDTHTTCQKVTKINDQEYELFNAIEFIILSSALFWHLLQVEVDTIKNAWAHVFLCEYGKFCTCTLWAYAVCVYLKSWWAIWVMEFFFFVIGSKNTTRRQRRTRKTTWKQISLTSGEWLVVLVLRNAQPFVD